MKKEKRKNICLTLLTDNIDSFDVIKIIFPSYGRNCTRITCTEISLPFSFSSFLHRNDN